jgi:hypothetical protein
MKHGKSCGYTKVQRKGNLKEKGHEKKCATCKQLYKSKR